MNPAKILSFDIGGTNLRAGVYCSASKRLLSKTCRKTRNHLITGDPTQDSLGDLFQDLNSLAEEILSRETVEAIAVAWPGPISPKLTVLRLPTVIGPIHRPFSPVEVPQLKFTKKTPTFHLNDVSAAGYRYVDLGYTSFCITTVASGIGSKIFLNGNPLCGNGYGGEIGHWMVDDSEDAPICECGGRGHLGAVASGRGAAVLARRLAKEEPDFARSLLASLVRNDPDQISAELLASAFRKGDCFAGQVIQRVAWMLAKAFALIHLASGIQCFVIFGGFIRSLGAAYIRAVAEAAAAHTWDSNLNWDDAIQEAIPDDNDALIGAALFAISSLQH